tara:strand:- start:2454 stop:3050 length:597 start_codon:yes stop_codon:yes gene_type:complete
MMARLSIFQKIFLSASCMLLVAGCCRWGGGGNWGLHKRSLAIPEVYPLGSVNRAHYHTMESNAEAVDFIINRNEFVENTAELTTNGKDHILEIGARMRSAPYPVIVERSDNNYAPELDAYRRQLIARILTDLGNQDADQRTIVSTPYGRSLNSREAEADYYRFISTRGGLNGGFGGGGGGGGGFGGGGGGGGGGGFGF